jgi:hypothetical protein
MDYEQEYYDLLFKYKQLESKNRILEDELIAFKSKKGYLAIAITYVEKIKDINKILNKIYVFNKKVLEKEKLNNAKENAEEILRIMEVEK